MPGQKHSQKDAAHPPRATRGDPPRVLEAVARLQAGKDEESSFRVLFEHYWPAVRRFLGRRVVSAEDLVDLTQETFLRIYKGVGGFRGDASFGTWVFRVAHNTHLKWLERRNRQGEIDLGGIVVNEPAPSTDGDPPPGSPDPPEDPLAVLVRRERRAALRRAIDALPDQMRRCMVLRVYHELSYREIAEAMRLSIETVKVHLFQARKRVRAALCESEDDHG